MATVAALVMTTTACGGKDAPTAPNSANAAGVYALQKIETAVLPVQIFDGPARDDSTQKYYDRFVVTINKGSLQLDPNGHYHTSFDYDLALNDAPPIRRTLNAQGTYTISGKRIVLLRDNGVDSADGTMENGEIAMQLTLMGNEANKAYVFRK